MIDWQNYPNFSEKEFKCRETGELKIDTRLLETLQEIRTSYGRAMNVTSGYRSAAHSVERRKIDRGGKPGSHNKGFAADIQCSGEEALKLLRIALDHPMIKGIGIQQKGPHDKRFLHFDIMEEGPRPNIWSY